MVSKIIWSNPARADLYNIARHIAEDRPDFAEGYCLRLIEETEAAVTSFPMSGRQVPRQPSRNLREVVLPPYRVIYEIAPDDAVIIILRVWDARRGEPELRPPSV